MKKDIKGNDYGFLLLIVILGLLNVIGTEVSILSLMATFIEYTIVLYLLFKGNYKQSFVFFLAFVAITLEVDIFIYGEKEAANTDRYTFINLPIIHMYLYDILAFLYLYHAYNDAQRNHIVLPETFKWLKKWLLILFVTGTITIFIGMVFNDNGIMNWSYYPKVAIIQVLGFLIKGSIILAAAYIISDEKWYTKLSRQLSTILAAIAIICSISSLLGFRGFYGDAYIMLSTLAVAFTPMLITFANKNVDSRNKGLLLASGLLIIIISLIFPTCIGSKWYIIILAAIAGWIIIFTKVNSFWKIGGVIIAGLFTISLLSEPIISLISGGNEFAEWKLTQAVKTINILGQDSAQDWYEDMDNSPLYRFDELHNTFIEYTEKPWYAVFGKGLGGTIRHHTSLLFWESGHGTFSESQIKMGAYYSMHETLAVLFLQHGIAGIYFFIVMLVLLAKRLYKTPWAMMGLIWIMFYWSYGDALIIGGIAAVLALKENIGEASVKIKVRNKHKN